LSQFFHLDNPVPDPVEAKMISIPMQIQNILNILPDWTLKSVLYTTARDLAKVVLQCCHFSLFKTKSGLFLQAFGLFFAIWFRL